MDAALEALVEKRKSLFNEMQELGKRERSADEEARFDAASAEYNAVLEQEKGLLDKQNRSQEVAKRLAEIESQEAEKRQGRRDVFDYQERRQADPEMIAANAERDRRLALHAWMRHSSRNEVTKELRDAAKRLDFDYTQKEIELRSMVYGAPAWTTSNGRSEQRAMSTSGSSGGYTIPQGFSYELEAKTLAYAAPRQVARVITTPSGNTTPWPVIDDTSNTGELLAENTSFGSSVDPTFSSISLLAYKYSSKPVLVSSEILQDSAFPLENEVAAALGVRIGRIQGTHLTTGDNSSKPQGMVNGSTLGVTAAGTTSITSDEIYGLIHSLDPSYRALPSVGFMMHDNILLYVRKLKDGNGAYLWQPSFQAGVPDRLLGYPIAINQAMQSSVATGTKTMLFGAFEKYIIRDAGATRMFMLGERYRDTDQTGFVAFKRTDGRYINAAAVNHLIQA